MSSIALQIKQDMVRAMKERDQLKTTVLRTVNAELKNFEIDKGQVLDNQDVVKVLLKLEKQRADALQAYQQAGRLDLASQEEQEQVIIQAYLPSKLSEAELITIIDAGLVELGQMANLGSLMKYVLARSQGQADGNTVRQLVQEKLAA